MSNEEYMDRINELLKKRDNSVLRRIYLMLISIAGEGE